MKLYVAAISDLLFVIIDSIHKSYLQHSSDKCELGLKLVRNQQVMTSFSKI